MRLTSSFTPSLLPAAFSIETAARRVTPSSKHRLEGFSERRTGYSAGVLAPSTATSSPMPASVPQARGSLSAALITHLSQQSPAPADHRRSSELIPLATAVADGPALDEDFQLSLWLLYQLHYRGLAGVDDRWEWHPVLLSVARVLEETFENHLRSLAAPHLSVADVQPADVPKALDEVIHSCDGPSLSSYLARQATREQYAEFVIHRSIYHLGEADPHSWAIPRLDGGPKTALVEIQADEYGGGRPEWMHAKLFADTMTDLGLDVRYAGYVEAVPAVTLQWANTMSLFGLHRRLRGATCGHLAALEMTSSLPNRRYGNGLRRLGLDSPSTTRYFDEHVEADAVHEQIAAHDLAAALARQDPILIPDILFGAACAVLTDAAVASHLISSWESGKSSLAGGRLRTSS
jgi:hypothetical protein